MSYNGNVKIFFSNLCGKNFLKLRAVFGIAAGISNKVKR